MKTSILLKRLGALLLFFFALLCLCWIFHATLLQSVSHAWIVNNPLSKADAIVVLGGGPETRPFEAARLYHLGFAPKILLTNAKRSPSSLLGVTLADAEISHGVLLKKEVPESAIFVTSEIVNSSYDEALAVRHWAKQNGVKRIIVPTDIFHTRRVRWLFTKELNPSGIQVEVEAVPVINYTAEDWWTHEEGVIAFQNEIIKYAYYRAKY